METDLGPVVPCATKFSDCLTLIPLGPALLPAHKRPGLLDAGEAVHHASVGFLALLLGCVVGAAWRRSRSGLTSLVFPEATRDLSALLPALLVGAVWRRSLLARIRRLVPTASRLLALVLPRDRAAVEGDAAEDFLSLVVGEAALGLARVQFLVDAACTRTSLRIARVLVIVVLVARVNRSCCWAIPISFMVKGLATLLASSGHGKVSGLSPIRRANRVAGRGRGSAASAGVQVVFCADGSIALFIPVRATLCWGGWVPNLISAHNSDAAISTWRDNGRLFFPFTSI